MSDADLVVISDVADATRLALLAIRLRAVADGEAITGLLESMGITVEGLGTLLGRLELAGLVEQRAGSRPGWRLTPEGRAEGERLLAVELDDRGVRSAVAAGYDRFISFNGSLLRACMDWQLRDANPSATVTNDHSDADYDAAVLERLAKLHTAVLPVCDELEGPLPRFGGYRPRFTTAMTRIESGDHDAFDKPDTDSYHSIWFELHEHLIATLGRDRATEPLP